MESKWAEYLQLTDSDVTLMKRDSQLKQPLGFLVFLDKVSREKVGVWNLIGVNCIF